MLKEKKSDSQAWFAEGIAIRKTTLIHLHSQTPTKQVLLS